MNRTVGGNGVNGPALCILAGLACLAPPAAPAAAQPLTERTPNLEGTWITSPRNLHFQFAHRFQILGEDADVSDIFSTGSVTNYPTFDLTYGLFRGAMLGVSYSSDSPTVGGVNEWQPFVKVRPLRADSDRPYSLALTAAYNGAAGSLDGELAAEARPDPFLLSGALRGFTSGLDGVEPPDGAGVLAAAGGLGVRVNRYVTLAADVADVLSGPGGDPAWSAGLHIGIPYTPHTFSLQATNVYSGTLEGTSVGGSDVFWGFEFTVPFSGFARWGRILSPEEAADAADGERPEEARVDGEGAVEEAADAAGDAVVEVPISELAFETEDLRIPAGTTVRWVNEDPVAHTSTSDDGMWDSGLFGPGETFELRFTEPGTYPYHCTPHPFMTGTVVVTD